LLRSLCVAGLVFSASCLSTFADQQKAKCEPIEGLQALLKPGSVLLLGELHGTVESPKFARDVACHAAAAGLDVVVALELSAIAKDDFEGYLSSARTSSDREAFLSGSQWQRGYQDGRTSRAMFDLIGELGRLRREGHSVRVALFDAQPKGGGQPRERAMAANVAASVEALPEAMHIVLTGNFHSRITPGGRMGPDYEPMGYLLSRSIGAERVTSLDVSHAGGSAWICAPECGVAQLRGRGSAKRWKIEIDEATRPAGHHGWYSVGTITASPPAVGNHDAVAPVQNATPVAPPAEPADDFPAQTPEVLKPFQGSWQAYQYGSKVWKIEFREQQFRGVLGPDDWYEGKIRLRTKTDPAQIDFVIEDCRCNYRGMTSKSIFRVTDETIVLATPQPGHPRPTAFSNKDGRMVELKRE
jgi:uncharacterized protein (TIGR03067 family)